MNIVCKNCSVRFEGRGSTKFCMPCRPEVRKKQSYEINKKWQLEHKDRRIALQNKSRTFMCLTCLKLKKPAISVTNKETYICKTCVNKELKALFLASLPPKRKYTPGNIWEDTDEFSSYKKPFREDWKEIPDYEGYYSINSQGVIRDDQKKSTRAWSSHPKGYATITLYKEGVAHIFTVHAVMAKTFMPPKPTEAHQINHMDLHKRNNCLENLEWVTQSENMKHYYDNKNTPLRNVRR